MSGCGDRHSGRPLRRLSASAANVTDRSEESPTKTSNIEGRSVPPDSWYRGQAHRHPAISEDEEIESY